MGESIAEGTVSKWLKAIGDAVERDEPILEISTDKVDAEIPAPASGTLVAIEVDEGETVEVGTIVAYIDPDGGPPESTGNGGAPAAEPPAAEAQPDGAPTAGTDEPSGEAPEEPDEARPAARGDEETPSVAEPAPDSAEERLRTRSTPVVRRIAEEQGVDIADVPGTGHAGRVTKQDILDYIESGRGAGDAAPAEAAPRSPEPKAPAAPAPSAAPLVEPSELWRTFYGEVQHPDFPVRAADRVEPMDKIRRLTAEHMVLAKRVAPHVHSFIEIDFTAIDRIRSARRTTWAEQGAKVSYTAFVVWACGRLLREFPMVNGTVSGNNLVYRGNVNVGMAVDLNPGLIVPVIHDTDELSLVGIGKRMVDLSERARGRKLQPHEIQGATFSVTNPGVLGTLVGMPIIPKGTSAILGTGAIEKRVVVVEGSDGADTIAIRKRALFSLGYDHRLVDGADAARFLSKLKELLEAFPEDA
jgi:2-oxoglutarate dehydrogenase E2 component (dihydrolipoamide succinyltransferase)